MIINKHCRGPHPSKLQGTLGPTDTWTPNRKAAQRQRTSAAVKAAVWGSEVNRVSRTGADTESGSPELLPGITGSPLPNPSNSRLRPGAGPGTWPTCCRQVVHDVRLLQQRAAHRLSELLGFQGSEERRRQAAGGRGGLILCDMSARENRYLHVLPGSGAKHLREHGFCGKLPSPGALLS